MNEGSSINPNAALHDGRGFQIKKIAAVTNKSKIIIKYA